MALLIHQACPSKPLAWPKTRRGEGLIREETESKPHHRVAGCVVAALPLLIQGAHVHQALIGGLLAQLFQGTFHGLSSTDRQHKSSQLHAGLLVLQHLRLSTSGKTAFIPSLPENSRPCLPQPRCVWWPWLRSPSSSRRASRTANSLGSVTLKSWPVGTTHLHPRLRVPPWLGPNFRD